MELGDIILSAEQLSSNKLKQKNKRSSSSAIKSKENVPTKYTKVIPTRAIEPVVKKKQEIIEPTSFKNVPEPAVVPVDMPTQYTEPEDLHNVDDPDMPGLEFLDMEEELQDFDADSFNERSPFIPGPFSDFDLKNRNIGDLLSDIDENELINRAPYIPPPCIDKIISFDDLSLPDIGENYQETSFNQQQPMTSTASFMDPNSVDPNQLYDFGNAKVPAHLLKRFLPAMSGKTDVA